MRANIISASFSRSILTVVFALYPVFTLYFYSGHFVLLAGGLMLVLVLEASVTAGRIWVDRRSFPVYLFYLMPATSALWSRYPLDTLWSGALMLANIAIFHLASRANAVERDTLIMRLSVIIPLASFAAFTAIYFEYGSVRVLSRTMADEVKSFSNHGAALSVLCIPYLLALTRIAQNKRMAYLCLGVAIMVVLLSQSRGAYLMLAFILIASPYFMTSQLGDRIMIYLRTTGFLMAIAVVVYLSFGYERTLAPVVERFTQSQILSEGLGAPTKGDADYTRALIYAEGIDLIREHPLMGIGYHGFARYLEEKSGVYRVSHNLIITIWGEMGIPGLFVSIWLLAAVVINLRRQKRLENSSQQDRLIAAATSMALLVVIMHGQFRPVLTNPLLPILLAQVYAISRAAVKCKESAEYQCGAKCA